jgi:hypothetical protein
MDEPTIICPTCKNDIKLTESLAAPLIESTRKEYEGRLAQKDIDLAKCKKAVRDQQEAVAKAREGLENELTERVQEERAKIVAEEAKKAKLALAGDLEQKARELSDLQDVLKQRDEKLAEAQKAQIELIRKQRELDDAKREMELTIEKRVQASLDKTREQAQRQAEEQLSLKVMEKEQTILSMQKQIDELKRKAEQGSQQLQGEVLELQLEALLAAKFPHDLIEPVAKGVHGGDILERVMSNGTACGTILWEFKRTKNWNDGWLAKLRDDQRAAKAEIAVIVSSVLPKGVETFDQIDGVWVTHPRAVLPVALALRQTLIEVNSARQVTEGQQTKKEMIYSYLTGPRFRQRVQAIVEAFSNMKKDLDKEKKVITKQWAKRDEEIDRVMEATVGMYGDMQGIAGKTLQEIEGLELKALEDAPNLNLIRDSSVDQVDHVSARLN